MRLLSVSLIYLLLTSNISKAIGFWSPFKYKSERPIKISKTNELTEIKEITWDDGEVVWENMQDEYYYEEGRYNITKKNSFKNLQPVYKITPLYEAIEFDQTKIASISAIVRTTYRETFNMETVISELSNKITSHYLIVPSEILVLSMLTGLVIIYNKTNETEKERLEKLYILSKPEDYYKKYEKMKRLSMVAIILLSCLTTKNVQPAN
jgi:hypothetical protein